MKGRSKAQQNIWLQISSQQILLRASRQEVAKLRTVITCWSLLLAKVGIFRCSDNHSVLDVIVQTLDVVPKQPMLPCTFDGVRSDKTRSTATLNLRRYLLKTRRYEAGESELDPQVLGVQVRASRTASRTASNKFAVRRIWSQTPSFAQAFIRLPN
jgi:hypothetical protein